MHVCYWLRSVNFTDFLSHFWSIAIDLILPEIWSRRPLKSQTGQVDCSIGKQVENSHQARYRIELARKHYTLKHKNTPQTTA